MDELIEGWGKQWPSEVAHVYAYMGDADASFAWLDKANAQKEDGLTDQFIWRFTNSSTQARAGLSFWKTWEAHPSN